jgi:hypothetical protein
MPNVVVQGSASHAKLFSGIVYCYVTLRQFAYLLSSILLPLLIYNTTLVSCQLLMRKD